MKITAVCLSRLMGLGFILKMVMLIPSIREWHQTRMDGGTSTTVSWIGIIPEWRRMKMAGGISTMEGWT